MAFPKRNATAKAVDIDRAQNQNAVGANTSGRGFLLAMLLRSGWRIRGAFPGWGLVGSLATVSGFRGRVVFAALRVFGVLRHMQSLISAAERCRLTK